MILQHELKLVAHTHSNNNYQASDELAIAQMGMNRVPIFRPFLLEWENWVCWNRAIYHDLL